MMSARESHTILVVEDEHPMRRLLGKLLAKAGTQVLLAADGAEAIEIYHRRQREISVVLLDLGLPKVSGWDVFNNIKEQNPEVRVVVASGFLEPEIMERLRSCGVRHFIGKPYTVDHLLEILHKEMEACQPPS